MKLQLKCDLKARHPPPKKTKTKQWLSFCVKDQMIESKEKKVSSRLSRGRATEITATLCRQFLYTKNIKYFIFIDFQ